MNQNHWSSGVVVDQLEFESEEFRQYLYDCIEKLPPRCKEIFKESRFENEKQEKIAEKNNISIKTVKAQIGKARITSYNVCYTKLLRDIWAAWACDREVTSGSSYIDFEFLQEPLYMITDGTNNQGYDFRNNFV